MVFVDYDDPYMKQYEDIFEEFGKGFTVVGSHYDTKSTTTSIINRAFYLRPDFDYYHITNDDFVYRTEGWDTKLAAILEEKGPGVAYGNDLLQMERMATAPFISGKVARALGWLQMPKLEHLGGDCAWMEIGRALEVLHYAPDVVIEHMHYQARKASIDKIYEKTNSGRMYAKDQMSYKEWRSSGFLEDIERIRTELGLRDMRGSREV